ncbi:MULTISPECIES: helix-turn-helix domain-containing protein [unclassified Chryseobacterium]|uniref:helix-turn-helix domain-containing protein n=1 Tax=unclassified Chryseobacterium TaxID=2593645 RepID=UPI000D3BCC9C|nr:MULTISPECIES: helix-turn-helix transcriptional regulator [unclassified Chryseobacterium]PTT68125.1 XRE family transcriptional regulator [Chryseobacterium sp. HMWF001]PVV53405.1 XRE family transcriptional regulator [Chryseobacterium sp. HMWF035]
MSLGTKLRALRTERNLSQTQVAMELDISQTAYCKWESDQTKPGIDNLLKISEFYEKDIYDLVREENGDSIYNNTLGDASAISKVTTINNYISDKLVEQYEERIKELQERNQELKDQIEFWKSKGESKT